MKDTMIVVMADHGESFGETRGLSALIAAFQRSDSCAGYFLRTRAGAAACARLHQHNRSWHNGSHCRRTPFPGSVCGGKRWCR